MSEEEYKAYNAFKTGLTFRDVYNMVWSYSDDSNDWPKATASPKRDCNGKPITSGRRHSVLGKWREIKLEMWHTCKPDEFRENTEWIL